MRVVVVKYNFYFLFFLLNAVGNNIVGSDNPSVIFDSVKKCGQIIMQNSSKIAKSIKQHGSKFEGLGNKLGKVFTDMATAAMAVTILKFCKEVAVEVKEKVKPGHERQLEKTTQEMNRCLFENKMGERSSDNMPINCKKHLDAYEKLAGPNAFNQLVDSYNKRLKRPNSYTESN